MGWTRVLADRNVGAHDLGNGADTQSPKLLSVWLVAQKQIEKPSCCPAGTSISSRERWDHLRISESQYHV